MLNLLENKKIAGIFLIILVVINVVLLYNRKNGTENGFDAPVPVGTTLNYQWIRSDKEIMFVFIKPKCGTCAIYKDSINDLFDKYGKVLQFKVLYNPSVRDSLYFGSFRFPSEPINPEMRKALHLAFTPQFILTENSKVTFVCNFYVEFGGEFLKLKNYLDEKYSR
jgi:hypothetical protein